MSERNRQETEEERAQRLERQRVGPEDEVRKSPEVAEARLKEDERPLPGPARPSGGAA